MSQVQLGSVSNYSARPEKALLQVSNLVVEFTKNEGTFFKRSSVTRAVDNATFEVRESEVLAIVGESGSGKTTIARCIMALTNPTSGTIRYNDTDITTKLGGKRLQKYRKEVQIIYQDPFESLNPRDNVFTIISTPLRQLLGIRDHKELVKITSDLLNEVELDPSYVMQRYPHQLSGGQRQRVNIARALAPSPMLLIADEPITMLDSAQRLTILALLKKLKEKRKLTIVMITHDLASAKIFSERILVMYSGKMVELGNTQAVLSNPHHPYVELILRSMPSMKQISGSSQVGDPNPLAGFIEDAVKIKQGCVFLPRCKYFTSVCEQIEPILSEKSSLHWAACHNPLNASS